MRVSVTPSSGATTFVDDISHAVEGQVYMVESDCFVRETQTKSSATAVPSSERGVTASKEVLGKAALEIGLKQWAGFGHLEIEVMKCQAQEAGFTERKLPAALEETA